jgi:hypothetical protein
MTDEQTSEELQGGEAKLRTWAGVRNTTLLLEERNCRRLVHIGATTYTYSQPGDHIDILKF